MTTNKDFKRLVRGRMLKTGESYTSARSHFLNKKSAGRQDGRSANSAAPAAGDYAKLAGLSDAVIKAKTGCDWKKWVGALDYAKAYEWPHGEIAEYVRDKFKVPMWWTQAVTVGYERIKGLRAIGQRRDGGYEVNKSRTFQVPLSRLYRGFSDKRSRASWLPGVDVTVRTATRNKSMRITWPDASSVVIGFLSKGRGKSSVYIQHGKIPNKATADKLKEIWRERLDALGEVLA